MKKLICEQDIKALAERGETCCLLNGPVIITPSARDAAAAAGISFRPAKEPEERSPRPVEPEERPPRPVEPEERPPRLTEPDREENQITPELVLRVLRGLAGQGRLPSAFCDKLSEACGREEDDSGVLILRENGDPGRELPQGNEGVRRRELFQGRGAGTWILDIDHGAYSWTPEEDEKGYVLEGGLSVSAGGRRYFLQRGDCLFVPRGVRVNLEAADSRCRVLCAACRPPRA